MLVGLSIRIRGWSRRFEQKRRGESMLEIPECSVYVAIALT
jgi:hypothetical protein